MHYDILNSPRKNILPFFVLFKRDFYLAGGTALALQIGHRQSVDFDFFSQKEFDPNKLRLSIKSSFKGLQVTEVQNEKNTLSIIVNGVKLSFFYYPYSLLEKLKQEEYLNVASVQDIAVMKLSAIVSRATNKDYIDMYYILQGMPLAKLLKNAAKKMPELDENLILKSLVYFKDIDQEPIRFVHGKKISFQTVEHFLTRVVKEYMALP